MLKLHLILLTVSLALRKLAALIVKLVLTTLRVRNVPLILTNNTLVEVLYNYLGITTTSISLSIISMILELSIILT